MKNRRIFLSSENLLLSDIIEYLTVEGSENYIASAAPIQAKMERKKIIPINDIIRPVTAKPLGLLKMPMNEKIRPNTQTIQPNMGIQPKNNAIKASMKPAVLRLFDFFSC